MKNGNKLGEDSVAFKLSPVGGDTNQSSAPWAVSSPPTSVGLRDNLKCILISPGKNKCKYLEIISALTSGDLGKWVIFKNHK